MKKKHFKLKLRFKILIAALGLLVFGITLYSQELKLREISGQREQLETQLNAFKNQETLYERMVDYAKTDEYMLELARQKLGWIKPDDIKFIQEQ